MLRKIQTILLLSQVIALAITLLSSITWADSSLGEPQSDLYDSDINKIEALFDGVKYALATHADPAVLQTLRDDALKIAASVDSYNPQRAAILRSRIAATLDGILQTGTTLRNCALNDVANGMTDRIGKGFIFCNDQVQLNSLSLVRFAIQLEHITQNIKPQVQQMDSAEWLRQTLVKNARSEIISLYYKVYSQFTAKMPADGAQAIELMTGKPPIVDSYMRLMPDKTFSPSEMDADLAQHLTDLASHQPDTMEERRANSKSKYDEIQSDTHLLRDLGTAAMHNGTAAYLLENQDDPFHPKHSLRPAPALSPSLPIPLSSDWKNPVEDLMTGKYAESARTVISLPDEGNAPGTFRMLPLWVAERESAHPDPQRLAQLESWLKSEMNILFPGRSDEVQSLLLQDFSQRLQREGNPADAPTLSRMFRQSLDSIEIVDRFGNPNKAVNIPREEYWVNRSAFEGKEEELKFDNPVTWQDEFRSSVGRQYDGGAFDQHVFIRALQSFYYGSRDMVTQLDSYRTGDPRKAIKEILMRDPGLLAPVLAENPELATLACQLWKEIPEDQRRAELWRKVRMTGEALVVGTAAVATVIMPFVGAPVLYTYGVAAVGTGVGLAQAGDEAYQGFQLQHQAEVTHAYLISRGVGDPDEIEREYSRANTLITEAIVEGSISAVSAGGLLGSMTKSPQVLEALSESKDAVIAAAKRLGNKVISPITPGARFGKFATAADRYIDELDANGTARLLIKDKPITDQEFLRISRKTWADPKLSTTEKLNRISEAMKRANKPFTRDSFKAIWIGNESTASKVGSSIRHVDDTAVDWFETRFLPKDKGLTGPVKFVVVSAAGVVSAGLTATSVVADHEEKKSDEDILKEELGNSYDMADIKQKQDAGILSPAEAMEKTKRRLEAIDATLELTRKLGHQNHDFDLTLSGTWTAAKDRIAGAFSKKTDNNVDYNEVWKSAIVRGGKLQPAFAHLTYYVDDGSLRADGTPRHTIWNDPVNFQRQPRLNGRTISAPLPSEQRQLITHQIQYITLRNGMERWYPPAGVKPKIYSNEDKDIKVLSQNYPFQKVFERLKAIRDGSYSGKTMSQTEFVNKLAQYLDGVERLRDYDTLGFTRMVEGSDHQRVPYTEKENEEATLEELDQLYPPKGTAPSH